MALDMARVRAICFDVDGTLSDTDDQWVASFEQRVGRLRRLFPRGEVRPFARWAIMCAETPGNLVYHLLDRVNMDQPVARVYEYLSRHKVGRKPAAFVLMDGVREMLLQMQACYPLAVVSARDHSGTYSFLNQFELANMFQAVATSLTCHHTKPYADPVLWAAAQMGVPPAHCLMVGDTTVDIRAGKAAGAQTVGVLCGFGQEAELRRAGADLILPNTAALTEIFFPKTA